MNTEKIDNINFQVYNKILGTYDYFIGDLIDENNNLKEGLDLFEQKIKKYEKEHLEKLRRNEEIVEDLKTENKILK